MRELRVKPQELMDLANEVAKKAEELSLKLRTLDDKIETVKANWEGMSANALYNTYVGMRQSLQMFPEAVKGIATQAQNAAKIYGQTDEDIANALK